MNAEDGYRRYQAYFSRPPLLVVEWRDRESEARGWLVINSLTGGAAGGGTRMKSGATRDEAIFLAKTMEIKFGVTGPPIGGAKSVIDFDPSSPEKAAVLRRWFQAVGGYLRTCYGTAGDLHVDEVREVIPLTQEVLGLAHPQEGLLRGHFMNGRVGEPVDAGIVENLRRGVEMPVPDHDLGATNAKLADLITGWGVARAVVAYHELTGKSLVGRRVLVEGTGAVGGPAALYLQRAGALVVGMLSWGGGAETPYRYHVDAQGLDVGPLLASRVRGALPPGSPESANAEEFWSTPADIFIPAAGSHTHDEASLDRLAGLGVELIACGANTPFSDIEPGALEVQRQADRRFVVIPDFVANCGMARAFGYLMNRDAEVEVEAMFADVDETIGGALGEIVGDGGPGLLSRAFARFIPV